MMNIYRLTYIYILIFFSCQTNPDSHLTNQQNKNNFEDILAINKDTATIKEQSNIIENEILIDSSLNFFSEFISCSLKDTLINNKYIDYSSILNDKYSKIRKHRLQKLYKWNYNFMNSYNIDVQNSVFYPFSGGDFLHAYFLYPYANSYLLLAQEKVGTIPSFDEMDFNERFSYMENINYVLRDIFIRSYFITKNMIEDSKETSVDGMLPIFLWALSITDHKIVNVQGVTIDTLGIIDKVEFNNKDFSAVSIDFFKEGCSSQVKNLIYISCDLSNTGLSKDIGLKKYLDKIPLSNSFIKSASYLMHYETFKDIRNIILNKSTYLVQDDTGIPFKFIKEKDFSINLFGKYVTPINDFSKNLYQEDLKKAYEEKDLYVDKLNFSLGYHWGDGNQNQMIFVRKR